MLTVSSELRTKVLRMLGIKSVRRDQPFKQDGRHTTDLANGKWRRYGRLTIANKNRGRVMKANGPVGSKRTISKMGE